MTKLDDRLQIQLDSLEKGLPVPSDETDSSAEARELAALLQVATAVREVEHPAPPAASQAAGLAKLLNASRRPKRPAWPSASLAFAGFATLVLFGMLLSALGIGFLFGRRYDTARVVHLDGYAEIATASGAWRELEVGDSVREGYRVRTYPASDLVLQFYDGSRISLAAETELWVEQLDGNSKGLTELLLEQTAGETFHEVIPLQSEASRYRVLTPTGEASVRGTTFGVSVNPQAGASRFAVQTGEVLVTAADQQVSLTSGQATLALAGQAPGSPNYQFRLQGRLDQWNELSLVVGNQVIQFAPETLVHHGIDLGDQVTVEGRVVNAIWIADIVRRGSQQSVSYISGTLEGTGEHTWQVAGMTLLVDENTTLVSDSNIGDAVTAAFSPAADGNWQALAIYPVASESPIVSSAPVADPAADPNLIFDPQELQVEACQLGYSLVGTLVNQAGEGDDMAEDVALGYVIMDGPEYISELEIVPDGWDVIPPGATVTFTINIVLTDTWLMAPSGDHFMLGIYVDDETNTDDHPGLLIVNLVNTCNATPTPTLTTTPTATLTPTVTVTPTTTPTPGPTQSSECTGANPHPKGMELATTYGVPYEEIMNWFCQYHFGFGEIDRGYSLSLQSGVPVTDIFNMRLSGMGWGQIRRALLGR